MLPGARGPDGGRIAGECLTNGWGSGQRLPFDVDGERHGLGRFPGLCDADRDRHADMTGAIVGEHRPGCFARRIAVRIRQAALDRDGAKARAPASRHP